MFFIIESILFATCTPILTTLNAQTFLRNVYYWYWVHIILVYIIFTVLLIRYHFHFIVDPNIHSTESIRFNGLHHLHKIVGGEVNSNYRQLLVDMSDNAVTSTTHLGGSQSEAESSDAECRLGARECESNESSYTTNSNTNTSRDASSQMGEKRKRPLYYSSDMDDDDDVTVMYDNFESPPTVENQKEHFEKRNGDDLDMSYDETVSMTSLDTDKSAKLKRGNQPLLRDKLFAKHHSGVKCMANLRNTEGLLSIAIKTIKLVKRNQLLQQRLTQLQMETTEFLQSVLANPENSHFRTKMQTSAREVENV